MTKREFYCPLQPAFKKVLDDEAFEDYHNANCFNCNNDKPPSEKTFEENMADIQLVFEILPIMSDLDERKEQKMSRHDLLDMLAKKTGMYN